MKTKFDNFLNEIDYNISETEYIIKNINNIISYEFLSKNNNSYSVYFMLTTEDDEILSNGKTLKEYTSLSNIPTIFFSLTNKGFGEEFDNLVNKNEYLEVMGKVIFLILEYMKNNEFNVYSIGEIGSKKVNFYNNYRKYFKDFTIFTGKSKNYKDENGDSMYAYYMTKNKNVEMSVDKIKLDENCYLILRQK